MPGPTGSPTAGSSWVATSWRTTPTRCRPGRRGRSRWQQTTAQEPAPEVVPARIVHRKLALPRVGFGLAVVDSFAAPSERPAG
jgi:hypothetical protein